MTKVGSHPIDLIEEYLSGISDKVTVELAIYDYTPQSVTDSRSVREIGLPALRREYHALRSQLRAEQEIAFQLSVRTNSRSLPAHVPMIDFVGSPPPTAFADAASILRHFGAERAYLYDSGRSFHMYGTNLVSKHRWEQMLGRLLLLNLPGRDPVVDTRWVGHRLIAGYGALRWSSRSSLHQREPRLVAIYR